MPQCNGGKFEGLNERSKCSLVFLYEVLIYNDLDLLSILHLGSFPPDVLITDKPSQDAFKIASKYRKVLLANSRQKHREDYYKFMMYRHPAERLLSAYRSKIESYPLLKYNLHPFNWLRTEIFQFTQPLNYQKWISSSQNESIWITFPDFIDHWLHLHKSNERVNDHFRTLYNTCKPCNIRYNYYGNFKYFNQDAEVLLRHQGADLSLLRGSYYENSGTTREIAPEYYRKLSDQQKKQVLDYLSLDLSFYYTIFPEERGSHKAMMNTSYVISDLQ